MGEMSVSAARAHLADVVDEARVGHEPVHLTRRGRRVAAIVDAADLARLEAAAEELADVQAAARARAEVGLRLQAAVPWDDVKAQLELAWWNLRGSGRVVVAPTAAYRLRELEPDTRRQVQNMVEALADDPEAVDAEPMVAPAGTSRVVGAGFRVVYEVRDEVVVLLVVAGSQR